MTNITITPERCRRWRNPGDFWFPPPTASPTQATGSISPGCVLLHPDLVSVARPSRSLGTKTGAQLPQGRVVRSLPPRFGRQGRVQAWLAPGGALPVVFAHTVVWFTAGSTTYEFEVFLDDSSYEPVEAVPAVDGTITIGRVQLTPDQKLLIVALCENVLRRGDRGAGHVPQSGAAAQRLGWTITKFNRKLDNVCEKLSELGEYVNWTWPHRGGLSWPHRRGCG